MVKRKPGALSTAAVVGIIVVILVAIVAGVYLFAPRSSSKATKLTLVTFSDPANAWMSWAAKQFEKTHPNVNITIEPLSFSSYIADEVSAEQTHSSQYDILGFTSTTALSVAPYLLNLNNFFKINTTDIPQYQLSFGGLYRNATTGATETIGAPYDSATFAMFYRTDIFNTSSPLGQQFYSEYHVQFNPSAWTNWTEVVWADQFLVNQTHTVEYGFLTDASLSHDIIDTFPAIYGWYYMHNQSLNGGTKGGITNYNIMFEGTAGSNGIPLPSFNSTAGLQALQIMRELVQYDPQPFGSSVNYGTIGSYFANGTAAGAIMFTPENPALVASSSKVNGKYAIAALPGNYSETGTDFLGVSKYSTHAALAAQFIQYLLQPSVNAQLYYQTGEFPISAQAVNLISANSSVSAWQKGVIRDVFETAAVAWANPPNIPPTAAHLIPDFNTPVYDYLTGSSSSSVAAMQALNQAAAAWVKDVS